MNDPSSLTRTEARRLVRENLASRLTEDGPYLLRTSPAQLLLSGDRFDIAAKLQYAQARVRGENNVFAREQYIKHILAFNGGVEADGTGKMGADRFLADFDGLIDSMRRRGFDETKPIPVSVDGVPVDGAHRVAAAVALGVDTVILETSLATPKYNWNFFENRGLDRCFLDEMARTLLRAISSSRIVVVWPVSFSMLEDVESIVMKHGDVLYRRQLVFEGQGQINFIREVYEKEPWVGSERDAFVGARNKAEWCFGGHNSVTVLALQRATNPLQMKEEVRQLLGLGKHSIHTADTNEESNRLSELLFNRNSLERISCAWPREYPWLTDLTETYRAWLVATSTSSHTCCIAGSAVMAAWGLREARDLDFLSVTGKMTATGYKEIDEHNREHARWSDIEPERIVLDPRYHGYWRGLKMMSIQLVRANKKRRGEPKDVHDVGLIDRALTGQTKEPVGAWVRRTLRPGFVKGRVKFLLLRLRFYATRIRNSDRFG